jgi:phosphoribosylanthranilate isomerase
VSLFIKVCGLGSEAAVAAALEAGVDAVGFVFHEGSARNLEPARAASLAARARGRALRVAVTRHPSQALVDLILATFAPDALQTDADDLDSLILPGLLETFPVVRTGSVPAHLPARCLYESASSGAGVRADWQEARSLAARAPLLLAGGLDPGNVAAAIATVRPAGVDVSSGVESAPGVKDEALIHAFVAAARSVANGSNTLWESSR